MKKVIGVDAGGSKTLALLVSESGEVLGRMLTGGANPRSVGQSAAAEALREALAPLLQRPVAGICVGAAGLARASDREFFETAIREVAGPTVPVLLCNDAQIALEAGASERPAMVVIAGTGSLVYGERADRTPVRCGGYGAVLGDPASGYALGLSALRHAARSLDGLEPRGRLADAVLMSADATSVPELVAKVHHWPPDIGAIAALASLVSDAAAQGDEAAKTIVDTACSEFREHVALVASRVRTPAELPVVIWGGAFEAVPELVEAVREAAYSTGPCSVGRASLEPAHGAAFLALGSLGVIRGQRSTVELQGSGGASQP
ncbi:MAG TPA: BadF/BadG/BcrA/BcrD ATPase family protein [Candidatus Acidoferrales bacterium]|nr:BadF/BadG/BcrA/BcrD ATPase family protein [Candidatus Acidoferrales bacterium]